MLRYILFLFPFWCDLYHFLLYLLPWCVKCFICKSIFIHIRRTQFMFLYELWLLLFFLWHVALFVRIIFSVSHVPEKKWIIFTARIRRMGEDYIFTLCVSPHLTAWQQCEYVLRGGRYASCVHAGGLSCALLFYKSVMFICMGICKKMCASSNVPNLICIRVW